MIVVGVKENPRAVELLPNEDGGLFLVRHKSQAYFGVRALLSEIAEEDVENFFQEDGLQTLGQYVRPDFSKQNILGEYSVHQCGLQLPGSPVMDAIEERMILREFRPAVFDISILQRVVELPMILREPLQ